MSTGAHEGIHIKVRVSLHYVMKAESSVATAPPFLIQSLTLELSTTREAPSCIAT